MYLDRGSYNSRGNVNPELQKSGLQDRPQTLHGKQARTFEQIRQLMDSKSRLVSQSGSIGSQFSGSNSEQRFTVSQPASAAPATCGSKKRVKPCQSQIKDEQGPCQSQEDEQGEVLHSCRVSQCLFAFLRGLGFSSLAVMLRVWPWP